MVSMWWRTGTVTQTSEEFDPNEHGEARGPELSDITGGETDVYPTEWHMIDQLAHEEVRQLSPDTYQLRDKLAIVTLDREGFNLYREANTIQFMRWMSDNNVVIESRVSDDKS